MEKVYVIIRHDNADGIQSNLEYHTSKASAINAVVNYNHEANNGLTLTKDGEIRSTNANDSIIMSDDAIWYEYDPVKKA